MEEIKLFLEGIENKLKRLLLRQESLVNQINDLEKEKSEKSNLIVQQGKRIAELEEKIEVMGAVKTLSSEDNEITKHKIDEILRDIDKCLITLNK